MDVGAVRDRLARVREDIASAQARAGVSQPVRIIGVTKGHPAQAVTAAAAAGLEDVGENRVQEALGKQELLGEVPLTWHLIGHLQTNKARLVPGRFGLVHSVDSARLAEALDRAVERAEDRGESPGPVPVLLQVNVAGETQKGGCAPAAAVDLAGDVAGRSRLALRGLMTMAPFTEQESVQRATFAGLRSLRESLTVAGFDLPELSMGMSGDYLAAVAEGATMIRLGTVLFGERPG